jgi:transcriptional regulator with XRE-family HTH domain
MITPEQVRAARALLRIEQDDLARRARVSITTIRRLEAAHRKPRVSDDTINGIRKVLEQAGAEFIEDGVRRRRQKERNPDQLYRELRAIAERSATQLADLPAGSESDLYDDHGLPV